MSGSTPCGTDRRVGFAHGENGYAIIADDLTGATDTAAAFVQAGFHATVLLRTRGLDRITDEIVVITTNSRHDSPLAARRKVHRACQLLFRHRRILLYKKMDSTVQGNIVAEVEAARRAGGFSTALVCPANPKQGRIVKQTVLEVRGKVSTRLDTHFASQGLRKHGRVLWPVTLRQVRHVLSQGDGFIIADATSERDLAVLAHAALCSSAPVLLAGSAGMAAELARALKPRRDKPDATLAKRDVRKVTTARSGPTLVFTGSNNPVTERQLAMLVECTGAAVIPLSERSGEAAHDALTSGRHTIVQVPIHRGPESVLLHQLSSLASLFREGQVQSLLLTGGDTALLVCRFLRPEAISLRGEILPGLAWGSFRGGLAEDLVVCTKPGGFGDDMSVVSAAKFFANLAG